MPRISDRAKAIAHQEHIVETYQRQCDLNLWDDDDDDSVHEMILNHHKKILKTMKETRYFFVIQHTGVVLCLILMTV